MHKIYILFFICFSLFLQTNAQNNARNSGIIKDKRGRKIFQNSINIKVKPEIHAAIKNGSLKLQSELIEKLKDAGIQEVSAIFPDIEVQQTDKRKFNSGIERLYRVKYAGNYNVEDVINMLENTGYIEFAEPVFVEEPLYIPNDPIAQPNLSPNDLGMYYLTRMKAYEAWDVHQGDTNTVIGIIDTGVRPTQEDLKDNIKYNWADPIDGVDNDNDGYIDNFQGWDLGDSDNNPRADGSPHGTEVASIAASTGDNGKGMIGTGFKCKFLPIKASPSNSGGAIAFGYEGLVYASKHGCKVANLSWGGTGTFSQTNQDIINYVALEKDVLILAAAGNTDKEQDYYPASYANVLSVSACDTLYSPSAGKLIEARRLTYSTNVDICAQGINVTLASNSSDNLYGTDGGTSFSTPMVAGAAALVRSKYPQLSAIQAAELIRVTADVMDTFPENLAYKGKMGKGRLNMYRALTDSISPAVRISSYAYKGLYGNMTYSGDTADLSMKFINYLRPSSSSLNVHISCDASFIKISDDQINLGTINTLQIINKSDDKFRISIDSDAPSNVLVKFRLDFSDPEKNYIDYQYITILINPDFRIVDTNEVSLTIAGNGRIGYSDRDNTRGTGMVFQNASMIYESGLMIATNKNTVSDCVRFDRYTSDQDFETTQSVRFVKPAHSDEETLAQFQDLKSTGTKVKIQQRTYSWKNNTDQNYVIVEYKIQNASGADIDTLHTGLFTDWDINDYEYNRANYDNTDKVGYCYNTLANGLYGGVVILTDDAPICFSMDNGNVAGTINPNTSSGFTTQMKYNTLSRGIGRKQAGNSGAGYDVSQVVGASLYHLKDNETRTLAFAYIAAEDLYNLKIGSRTVRAKYREIKKSPLPVITDTYSFCKGDTTSLVIIPSNGASFNFYKSVDKDAPVYTGQTYTINNISTSDTIFVTGIDSLFESVGVKVPIIFNNRSTALFSVIPDTVVDVHEKVFFVDQSSSSNGRIWNLGDGEISTASLTSKTFEEPGEFEIKLVSLNENGCSDTLIQKITVRIVSGINSTESEVVSLYPNPVENTLYLNLKQPKGTCNVSVMNTLGEILYQENIDTNNPNHEINASDLVPGVYFLKVVSGNNITTKKFNKL